MGTAGPQRPDTMPEDMPDRMPEGMPDRMSDGMPEGMPDKVPECLPDRMPEDLPDRMPDRMSEDMPEDVPDRVPEDMPEHMPEDMPDKMPEDMPDRMPEDMALTKRINVMVGITRSKVIVFNAVSAPFSFFSSRLASHPPPHAIIKASPPFFRGLLRDWRGLGALQRGRMYAPVSLRCPSGVPWSPPLCRWLLRGRRGPWR